MANFFADRVSIVYGGLELDGFQLGSFSFDVDIGIDFVDTMSDDYSVAGYTRANTKVTGTFMLKVPAQSTLPPLELLDPQANNLSLVATIASSQFNPINFQGTTWILGGVATSAVSTNFSGPGTSGERTYSFKATKYTIVPPTQGG